MAFTAKSILLLLGMWSLGVFAGSVFRDSLLTLFEFPRSQNEAAIDTTHDVTTDNLTNVPDKALQRRYNLTISTHSPGIGNQFFELASLLGVAHKTGMNIVLPPNITELKDNLLLRETRKFPTRLENGHTNAEFGNFAIFNKKPKGDYDEKTNYLDERQTNIELSGYYHSFKYFQDIEDHVRQEFTFKDSIRHKVKQFMTDSMAGFDNYTLVGIHVRRGDFLREDAQKFGDAVATPEYINKSITFFEEKFPRVWFFAAGNGGNWTKEHVKAKHVTFTEGFSALEDMALLGSCDHTIATVGTFSWWAAWFANGITTYYGGFPVPNTRLGNRYIKEEYIPPNWISM